VRVRAVLLPIGVVIAGALIAFALVRLRRPPERMPTQQAATVVRVVEVAPRRVRLDEFANGEVAPRTTTQLVAQVPGVLAEVSPGLAAGAFFDRHDVLARIDATDLRLAAVQAEARVAEADVALAIERREAEIAREDWEALGEGEPNTLVLREPQTRRAEAALAAAEAALEKARVDVDRATIRAPYRGRVRTKLVDVGQYVAPGTPLAVVYSIDDAEVRLPVPEDEVGFLDLGGRPEVALWTELGGERARWTARVVRTEAIDPSTRTLHAVALVSDPYGSDPPLTTGSFVHARITGRSVDDVFIVPRHALRDSNVVYIVDDEDRLRFRSVAPLRVDRDEVVVSGGLAAGDRVCVSVVELAVDGMEVRVLAAIEVGS